MSYASTEDFLALVRNTPNGVRITRMPGLDFVIPAMSRAGMIKLWVGAAAPTTEQQSTVWFKPALPSWSAEGAVFLWDGTEYDVATPALWSALINRAGTLSASVTYDPPSLAAGTGATTTVPVPGAALGDFVAESFSVPLAGVLTKSWVSAPDVVSVRFYNSTGSVVDLAAGVLAVRVT